MIAIPPHIGKSIADNPLYSFETSLKFSVEYSQKFLDDKKRSSALVSICSLLNLLLPERQPNKKIYNSFENLVNSINLDNWIILYIFFELNLIKDLGYDTNLSQFKNIKDDNLDSKKIKIDGYTYEIPIFLISRKSPEKISNILIKKSLYFTRNIILNRFFLPNNLSFPKSRVILENYFN